MNRFVPLIALLGLAACAGLASVEAPVTAEADDRSGDDLSGEYVRWHTITYLGEKDWEEGEVRDTLAIRQQGTEASFFFALIHTNFHLCEMEGSGVVTADGLIAAPEEITFGGETDTCRLRIAADADTLRLVDEGNVCRRYYCGARGFIDGIAFPRR